MLNLRVEELKTKLRVSNSVRSSNRNCTTCAHSKKHGRVRSCMVDDRTCFEVDRSDVCGQYSYNSYKNQQRIPRTYYN